MCWMLANPISGKLLIVHLIQCECVSKGLTGRHPADLHIAVAQSDASELYWLQGTCMFLKGVCILLRAKQAVPSRHCHLCDLPFLYQNVCTAVCSGGLLMLLL